MSSCMADFETGLSGQKQGGDAPSQKGRTCVCWGGGRAEVVAGQNMAAVRNAQLLLCKI